jgi:hypothetical protein
MPIILTCPHGGSEELDSIRERTEADTPADCDGSSAFNDSRDVRTIEVTEGMAQKILDITGLSPYVVIALFHRRWIDANRRRSCAFTDQDAAPFYDEYHNRIDGYIDQIRRENNNRGFLFDIHGTGEAEADIFLGTRDGDTLRPEFSRNDLFRRHGLAGLLNTVHQPNPTGEPAEFEYRVNPGNAAQDEILNGGMTVRRYSSRLNCIQIEITRSIRDDDTRRDLLIEALAFALINFVRRHAPF